MDEQDDIDGATLTTTAGLTRLATVITDMVRTGALDTRFGAKLFKRIDKEAKRVIEHGQNAPAADEESALLGAIGELDIAVRQRDAALLVEANARLRDSEDAAPKRRKSK